MAQMSGITGMFRLKQFPDIEYKVHFDIWKALVQRTNKCWIQLC